MSDLPEPIDFRPIIAGAIKHQDGNRWTSEQGAIDILGTRLTDFPGDPTIQRLLQEWMPMKAALFSLKLGLELPDQEFSREGIAALLDGLRRLGVQL